VAADGRVFENALRAREASNRDFDFMVGGGPENDYYRWRVYATMMRAKDPKKAVPPACRLQRGGPWWRVSEDVAANFDDDDVNGALSSSQSNFAEHASALGFFFPCATTTTKEGEKAPHSLKEVEDNEDKYASRGQRTGDATLRDVAAMEVVLEKTGDLRKASVRDAMFIAIDCADAARQVVDLLSSKLAKAATLRNRRLALGLLFVVSDVLHNSGSPSRGARLYRTLLRPVLPASFRKLGGAPLPCRGDERQDQEEEQNAEEGKLNAEASASNNGLDAASWRRRVLGVLGVWTRWSHVFPPSFVYGLELTFLLADGDDGDARALRFEPLGTSYSADERAEFDALKRDARLVGLDEASPKPVLQRRLGLVRLYVRRRALGLAAEPALAEAKQEEIDRALAAGAGDDGDDDDSLDGEPIDDDDDDDEPPPATASFGPRLPRRSRFETEPPAEAPTQPHHQGGDNDLQRHRNKRPRSLSADSSSRHSNSDDSSSSGSSDHRRAPRRRFSQDTSHRPRSPR